MVAEELRAVDVVMRTWYSSLQIKIAGRIENQLK